MIEALIFDVGGVLSEDIVDNKLIDLADKHGKDPALLLQLGKEYRCQADLGEISDPEFWRLVLEKAGISATSDDSEIRSYLTLMEGSLELARSLQKRYRLAILSNDSREMAGARRQLFHFDAIFDPIVLSSDVGFIKPDLQIYAIALEKLELKAEQCVFIDDRVENIEAAAQKGLQAILFQGVSILRTELIARGVVI